MGGNKLVLDLGDHVVVYGVMVTMTWRFIESREIIETCCDEIFTDLFPLHRFPLAC